MLRLNVNNETSKLKAVVLGIGNSLGSVPTANECYDPKSRFHVLNGTYPKEIDIVSQLDSFNKIFLKYDINVFRPSILKNVNQIFTRDIGFVIGNKFFKFCHTINRAKQINLRDQIKFINSSFFAWRKYSNPSIIYETKIRNFIGLKISNRLRK